jgi:hypothetical protein
VILHDLVFDFSMSMNLKATGQPLCHTCRHVSRKPSRTRGTTIGGSHVSTDSGAGSDLKTNLTSHKPG